MSTALAASLPAVRPPRAGASPWLFWGRAMVLPYLIVFVVFVLYPVGYGLWLARHPQSYVKLFEDRSSSAPRSTPSSSWWWRST